MTDHSSRLERYRRIREVRLRLNQRLVRLVPKKALEECGRKLGLFRKGMFVFESEAETSLLMDYCLYEPGPDGRNLVAKYLDESPPPAGSEELAVLQAMTHAYYSLVQVTAVERGVGVAVQDLLRNEAGFIVDVGFGNSAAQNIAMATRIIPCEDFLTSGGAALPVDAPTATRIVNELTRAKMTPGSFDFRRITPRQEAELAAMMIRACRSSGMSSHIVYQQPGSSARPGPGLPVALDARTDRRNARCPCGSGKKYKVCCGRAR